jgi:hypothetical protein
MLKQHYFLITTEIEFRRGKKLWQERAIWLEYIFSEKPIALGHYTFVVDYRGWGGSLNESI